MTKRDVLRKLGADLPPIVFRNNPRLRELIGLSPRSLANLDCLGQGPPERILIGRLVGYPRDALIAWLRQRSKVVT